MPFFVMFALFAAILSLLVFPTGFFLWTTCAVAIGAGLAYLVALRLMPSGQRSRTGPDRTRPIERAYLAILLFLLLTLLPLPTALSRLTGAERFAQNRRVATAVATTAELGVAQDSPLFFASTRNKAGTLRVTFTTIAMFGVAMLASLLPHRSKITYVRFICCLGGVVATAGLWSRFQMPQGDTLWWIYPIPHVLPGPLAGFTSPNHFGALLAMLCPAQLALMVDDFSNRRLFHGAIGVAIFTLMSFGIVFSFSRGSFVAYMAGILVALILLAYRRRTAATVALGVFGAAVIAALILFAGPEVKQRLQTLQNITRTDSYTTRLSAWRDSVRVLRTYPLTGAGANAFRMVYPQHRRTSDGAVMTHAENEYIQLLTDTGLAGLVLFLALARVLRRDVLLPALAGASDTAILVAGTAPAFTAAVHSMMDFPLHIPIYAITLASLFGLLLPFSFPSTRQIHLGKRFHGTVPVTATASALAALVLGLVWGRFQRLDSASVLSRAALPTVRHALAWAPTSSEAWQQLGRTTVVIERNPETLRFRESCVTQAVAYDPNNYRIWNTLGELRNDLGDRESAAEAFARVKELRDWYPVPFLPEELR